jgi:hypothetical protein
MVTCHLTFINKPTMAPVSEDLAWAIVCMMPVLDINSVSAFTSVSHWKIYQILALYRSTGAVIKHQDTHILGCLRHLTPEDVAVSDNFSFFLGSTIYVQFLHGSLHKNYDLYLDELRQSLDSEGKHSLNSSKSLYFGVLGYSLYSRRLPLSGN